MSAWRAEAGRLPIGAALPALESALEAGSNAVLVAPPGAGKTTLVPLALAEASWAGEGRIIVLEPRRLAARAAASRMAALLGQEVGARVGYRVRLDTRVSAATRIEVVTEGVFTRMILDDPGLDGVAAVIFDEFHERSLDADLGLALAVQAQRVLRPDLRLLPMSATLDGAAVAAQLGEAPVIETAGRQFEVETRYLGRDAHAPLEPQVARAVLSALAAIDGDVLVFLPGQAEIARTQGALVERLGARPVDILPLYGGLDLAAQDAALAPAAPGRRKVVLATAIAQTSLTLEGVRAVVDSGLSRGPRFDPGSGLTRLVTTPVSRASADQRRGRAGRTAAGLCYRLWDEAQTRALPAFDRPEILESDLSRLALDLARWGAADPADLVFLDPPPAAAFAASRRLLADLGALDSAGVLTAHGRAIAQLPLPPRLAHMVLRGAAAGAGLRAARLAAVIVERGLGGASPDLGQRLDAAIKDRSLRARAAMDLAERWARLAERERPEAPRAIGGRRTTVDDGALLAAAWPDRIAKARGAPGEFLLASGRGARLDPAQPLARAPWLAIAELAGGGAADRILAAAPLDIEAFRAAHPEAFAHDTRLVRSAAGAWRAERAVRLGAIAVEAREVEAPPDLILAALLDEVRRDGLTRLPWSEESRALRARVGFLRRRDPAWPDLSDDALLLELDAWLSPWLEGSVRLEDLSSATLHDALLARLDGVQRRRLDAAVPRAWTSPTGASHAVDYLAEQAPLVRARVQELFGLGVHPQVAGEPLTLALLSPAHREIQVTRDLPRFWAGSWADVRKEMRGRYPRHPWPEDPTLAAPTTRANPRRK